MDFSVLNNLQLNSNQTTLSRAQQKQLIEVIGRLLWANYNPHEGSILIVRTWADGTFEEILSGNLAGGRATGCHTQTYKQFPRLGLRLVNDSHCNSADYVDREVSEAMRCDNPGSFYYGKLSSNVGSVYTKQGHYVLSLPLENGRLIASFRAHYCWRQRNVSSSISEPWQHELLLVGLAEVLQALMSQDQRLTDSFEEVMSSYDQRGLVCYTTNSNLIQRCLSHGRKGIYGVVNTENSKLPYAPIRAAYA